MIVLDAGVLIAHLDSGDGHHARTTDMLLENSQDEFASSAVTLAEVLVGALRAGRGDEARSALSELEIQTLGLDPGAAWELARLRVATGLKLPDCCVLYVARTHASAQLATFDARPSAAAADLGIGIVPG